MTEIGFALPPEAGALAELEKKCFSTPYSAAELEKAAAENSCLAANVDGVIVGYCFLRRIPFASEIGRLAVDPDWRRRGIGRLLLREAVRLSDQRGDESLQLEVRSRNAAAIALYESEGFVRVGLRKNYYRLPDDDAILMDRRAGGAGASEK